MSNKRRILLIIAAILVISLAACGTPAQTDGTGTTAPAATKTEAPASNQGNDNAQEPSSSEPMNISIALWDIGLAYEDDSIDPMKQFFYEKFNIVIEPRAITWGDAGERYQVWASSDSMPDVCGGLSHVGGGMYFQWIEDQVVRPLPDDLSAYPLVEQYVSLPEVQAYQVEGKNYIMPRMTYADKLYWCMDRGVYYRKDWRINLGLEEPTTTDEFIDMCIAFTNDDPDGNGEKDTFGVTTAEYFVLQQNFVNFGYTSAFWRKVDGKWVISEVEPVTIPLVDMYRKLWKAGALDPDFAAHTSTDPGDNLFTSGRAGVYGKQNTPGSVNGLRNKWMEFQPDLEFLDCVDFLPMWDIPGSEKYMFTERHFWSETYVGSQVDDEKMARILAMYDWLYSEDGMNFMLYGFEGEDYKIGANGEVEILLPVKDTGVLQALNEKYPFARLQSLACWPGSMKMYENPRTPKDIRDWCAEERDYRIANWKDPDVNWQVAGINVPEKQETTYSAKNLWTVIIMDTSDTPTETLYETYMVPELEAGGYYRMLDAVNAAAKDMGL